jgi:hypothetical protein
MPAGEGRREWACWDLLLEVSFAPSYQPLLLPLVLRGREEFQLLLLLLGLFWLPQLLIWGVFEFQWF